MKRYFLWYKSAIKSRLLKKYVSFIGEDAFYERRHQYAGTQIKSVEETSRHLEKLIMSNQPIMAGRYGLTEMFVMRAFFCDLAKKKKVAIKQLAKWSGFFPETIELGEKFTEIMIDCSKDVDYLAINLQPMEEFFIKEYVSPNVILAEFRGFEPWYKNTAWTRALKGKKVLVIHPFAETIEEQYKKRTQLFLNQDILPDFTLITLKAVQTSADEKDSRFATWFDALQYMYQEAMTKNFDIALLGCGAYGFPLSAMLKRSGKQAIHMGGMLQILFGIKGKRWDDDRIVSPLYNEYWVRPKLKERPQKSSLIEGGCYW